ncbi:hypothetical protein NUW54_g13307 [Trametes sanguinea]|uniref:Uncharacterized protein n=1 Tax=Trametes sanguinea TaxID=158606 RepID=A0ACC1MN84_9APHY|nr:hypothetical protein NUW54_g13307 [Trametes sanguinea]
MSLDEAVRLARGRRKVVRPNQGFMVQLRIFEKVTRLREAQERRAAESAAELDELDLDALARRVGVLTTS